MNLELLRYLRARPGRFLLEVNLSSAIHFFLGMYYFQNNDALLGFREWLIVRTQVDWSVPWTGICNRIIARDLGITEKQLRNNLDSFNHPDQQKAVDLFLGLLEAFFIERDADEGLMSIFVAYHDFRNHQTV